MASLILGRREWHGHRSTPASRTSREIGGSACSDRYVGPDHAWVPQGPRRAGCEGPKTSTINNNKCFCNKPAPRSKHRGNQGSCWSCIRGIRRGRRYYIMRANKSPFHLFWKRSFAEPSILPEHLHARYTAAARRRRLGICSPFVLQHVGNLLSAREMVRQRRGPAAKRATKAGQLCRAAMPGIGPQPRPRRPSGAEHRGCVSR
ncbi:hypothetical protein QBC39DRAFT_31259 [Podospora conica]|nr:hypothetical protein QBC39DRAFT_31259 [Schizothecium conicum]